MELAVQWVLALSALVFMIFTVRKLKDQRGEVAPDASESDSGDTDADSADEGSDIDLKDVSLDFGGDEEDTEKRETKDKASETPDSQEDKKQDKGGAKEPTVQDLMKQMRDKDAHIQNLYKALHQERQAKKGAKAEGGEKGEDELSDSQLLAIMQQHKDDPQTLFNVMKYMKQQGTKDATSAAQEAAKVSTQKATIEGNLYRQYPDLATEGSELRNLADTVKSNLGLKDHPFGDLFAMGVMSMDRLPTLMQQAYERGKTETLNGKAEENRKADIKARKPIPSGDRAGKDKAVSLTKDQLATAKTTLGLTNKRQIALYARLLGGKASSTVEVNDED